MVLARLSGAGLLRAGGRQRNTTTHVLAAVRTLNRMEFVGETLRAALEALAAAAPGWLAPLIDSSWADRYGARIDSYRFPKGRRCPDAVVRAGRPGRLPAAGRRWRAPGPGLAAADPGDPDPAPRLGPAVPPGRDKLPGRREGNDLPPGGQRCLASPYDLDARYGIKRGAGWTGYKDHLTETNDLDMPRVITNVETTDATTDDVEMTQTIHQHLDINLLVRGRACGRRRLRQRRPHPHRPHRSWHHPAGARRRRHPPDPAQQRRAGSGPAAGSLPHRLGRADGCQPPREPSASAGPTSANPAAPR